MFSLTPIVSVLLSMVVIIYNKLIIIQYKHSNSFRNKLLCYFKIILDHYTVIVYPNHILQGNTCVTRRL